MSQTSVEILDNIAKLTTTLKDEDDSDHDSNDHYLNSCEIACAVAELMTSAIKVQCFTK